MLVLGSAVVYSSFNSLKAPIRFIWHCFLRPLGSTNTQKDRLDQVYSLLCLFNLIRVWLTASSI